MPIRHLLLPWNHSCPVECYPFTITPLQVGILRLAWSVILVKRKFAVADHWKGRRSSCTFLYEVKRFTARWVHRYYCYTLQACQLSRVKVSLNAEARFDDWSWKGHSWFFFFFACSDVTSSKVIPAATPGLHLEECMHASYVGVARDCDTSLLCQTYVDSKFCVSNSLKWIKWWCSFVYYSSFFVLIVQSGCIGRRRIRCSSNIQQRPLCHLLLTWPFLLSYDPVKRPTLSTFCRRQERRSIFLFESTAHLTFQLGTRGSNFSSTSFVCVFAVGFLSVSLKVWAKRKPKRPRHVWKRQRQP